MCPIVDPSDFTHPYTRPGTYLYSESGAKYLGDADADTYADEHAPALIGTDAGSELDAYAAAHSDAFADGIYTFAFTVDRDRDSRVPTDPYRRTPAHALPYDEQYDRERLSFIALFGYPGARHARGDRAE